MQVKQSASWKDLHWIHLGWTTCLLLLHYFFKNLFLSVRLSVSPAPFSSTSQAAATRTFRETAVPLFCRRLVCLSFLHLYFFPSASAESRFCASWILLVLRSSGREKK